MDVEPTNVIKLLKNEMVEGTLLAVVQGASEHVTNGVSDFSNVAPAPARGVGPAVFYTLLPRPVTIYWVVQCLTLLVRLLISRAP